jgi:hypothetical protein
LHDQHAFYGFSGGADGIGDHGNQSTQISNDDAFGIHWERSFSVFSIIPQLKEKSKGILLYMGEGNGLRLFVILGLSVYNGKPVCYTENEVKKK